MTRKPANSDALVSYPGGPENAEEFLGMTLREICDRYGTFPQFLDHLNARKKAADIRRIELQNAETEGKFIPREYVRQFFFGALDGMNRRLLTDMSVTLAFTMRQMAKADCTLEEMKHESRTMISAELKRCKRDMLDALRRHDEEHGKEKDETT